MTTGDREKEKEGEEQENERDRERNMRQENMERATNRQKKVFLVTVTGFRLSA